MRPYTPLELAGRDIYVREGCYICHSQMIRPLRDEVERYGHYSLAAESMYDQPFQWGSKRTGPDLARVGGKYSDEWHRAPSDRAARGGAGSRSCRAIPSWPRPSSTHGDIADDLAPSARRRALQRRDDRQGRRRPEGPGRRRHAEPGRSAEALSQGPVARFRRQPAAHHRRWMR